VIRAIIAVTICLALLAGCGQKGALVRPQHPAKTPVPSAPSVPEPESTHP
jgi:predicted small lipoprotein YifL